MIHLPSSSLVQSRSARIELARQRFFEEGQSPAGIVGEVVFESWARCLRQQGSPRKPVAFEPVTASRTQLALTKNRQLRQAWDDELPRLQSLLGTTSCAAMLTDATGILIGSSCVGRPHEAIMPVATRLGVNLSEDVIGTNAPGVVARTGKAVSVHGGEHFFDNVADMHCAAAPICDVGGRLVGVLDISSERIPFAFDAAAVVSLYAAAIENRVLVAQSTDHLVVRFQVAPELLDSAMAGLVGIDARGLLAWENGVARSLLGPPSMTAGTPDLRSEARLGRRLEHLLAWPGGPPCPLHLPNGLTVWARADLRAADGRRGLQPAAPAGVATIEPRPVAARTAVPQAPQPDPAAADPRCASTAMTAADGASTPASGPATAAPPAAVAPAPAPVPTAQPLREASLELILQALQAQGGNVSAAAARLGVSRGLIYRRLRQARAGVKGS